MGPTRTAHLYSKNAHVSGPVRTDTLCMRCPLYLAYGAYAALLRVSTRTAGCARGAPRPTLPACVAMACALCITRHLGTPCEVPRRRPPRPWYAHPPSPGPVSPPSPRPPCWPSPGLLPGLAPCLRRRRRLLPTPSPLTAPDPAKSATWPPQSDNEDEWGEEETPKAPAPKVIMVGRVIKDYIPEKVGRQLTLLLGTAGPPSGRRSPPPAQHPLTRPAAAARPCARACRRAGVRLQQGVARGPRLVGGTLPPPRRRSGHVATSLSGRLAHASPTPSPGRDPRRAGLLPARVHRGGEEVTPSCFRLSALYNCTRTNTHHAGGVQLSWPRRRRRRAAAGCATPPATPPAARTPGVPSSGSLGAAWWAGPP